MNIETFLEHCLAKKGVEETFPFDETTLVMKVMNKMFAICPLEKARFSLSLKCDPEYAIELRELHEEIMSGFHLNNKHWNTVDCEGTLSDKLLKSLIDHSYEMVVKGMTKKDQLILSSL